MMEKPALMIAGGRPRDPSAMARMMSPAFSGIHRPLVAYIGTANGDSEEFYRMMASTLAEAGADKTVFVHLASASSDPDAARETLAAADVIFLAGGEVEDGMRWLHTHGLTGYLRDLYASGKQFIGVSAGVIMMGTHWVRWDVPEDDRTSSLFDCLGMIPRLFDVHGEEEDWVELKAALKLMGDGALGYALPAGSLINADSAGVLVNLEKEYLIFTNDAGNVRLV